MEAQERQKALDSVSAEDLEKVNSYKASTSGGESVDNEWLLMAEFAKAYGWEAYKDARDDKIGAKEMLTLIEANRKLEAREDLRNAMTSFTGAASAASKKPSATFKSLTKHLLKESKVKES